jgi:Protein of unknown function (DUF2505)
VVGAREQRLATALHRESGGQIPLVAGKLEKSIGAELAKSIPAIHRFTTTWIAEHA